MMTRCLVLAALMLPTTALAQDGLILPLKAKAYTVEHVSDWAWSRPIPRHTKIAIGAVVVTIAIDAAATGFVLNRINRVERDYRVSLVDRKEVIGTKALGNFLTLAQLFAQARRAPKTTSTIAGITTGLNLWSVYQQAETLRVLRRIQ